MCRMLSRTSPGLQVAIRRCFLHPHAAHGVFADAHASHAHIEIGPPGKIAGVAAPFRIHGRGFPPALAVRFNILLFFKCQRPLLTRRAGTQACRKNKAEHKCCAHTAPCPRNSRKKRRSRIAGLVGRSPIMNVAGTNTVSAFRHMPDHMVMRASARRFRPVHVLLPAVFAACACKRPHPRARPFAFIQSWVTP